MEQEKASRRSFLGKLLGGGLLTGLVAAMGSVLAYIIPPHGVSFRLGHEQVKIGKATDVPLGKGKLAMVGDEPVWVVHLARGFAAFSATCTHKGCVIKWEEKRGVFSCPCHDGLFDAHGNVIAGMPRRPLPAFPVDAVNGEIYALPRRIAAGRGGDAHGGLASRSNWHA